MFYPLENEKTGEIIIGDPNYDESRLLFSEDNAPHTYYSKTTPLSGKKGIEFALKKGFIRKSTEAEIKKWNQERRLIDLRMAHKYSKKEGYGPPLLKVPRWSYTILTDGYVIPADTTASFIVLEGANLPLAKFGRASVSDMNTMQCYTSSPVDGCRKVREPVAKNDNIKKK